MLKKTHKFVIFLTSLVLGIMIFAQYQSYKDIGINERRDTESNIFRVINVYLQTNQNLKNEISKLSAELENYQDQYKRRESFQKTLSHNEILSGSKKTKGPGLKLTINNKINTQGLVDLTNEMWNAGAEVIAVNGNRLTENTAGFAEFGSNITLSGVPLTPPFIIEAIGNSELITQALEQSGSILSRLKSKDPSIKFNLQTKEEIVIQGSNN